MVRDSYRSKVLAIVSLMALVCAPMSEKLSLSRMFNTLIVPSMNIESISPMMKHCLVSSVCNSLLRSDLPDHLV